MNLEIEPLYGMGVIGGTNKQTNFIFFGSFHTSLRLPLQLALLEGHMYCFWPLRHILLVCTTLVCVLFVATTTYTITVYYFSMCTVCGHYHVYYYCVLQTCTTILPQSIPLY